MTTTQIEKKLLGSTIIENAFVYGARIRKQSKIDYVWITFNGSTFALYKLRTKKERYNAPDNSIANTFYTIGIFDKDEIIKLINGEKVIEQTDDLAYKATYKLKYK